MRVVLIDNYDSFVYNLAQYLGGCGADPVVVRNHVSAAAVGDLHPDAVVVSPGPGRPEQAGCSMEVIMRFHSELPVLGVCLGHQAIGAAFGAVIVPATELMHGKTSEIHHDGLGLFAGLPPRFEATRYHSLVIDPDTVPTELIVTARTSDGAIMGVRHREYPVEGVQFHPESALTETGHVMIENFLESVTVRRR